MADQSKDEYCQHSCNSLFAGHFTLSIAGEAAMGHLCIEIMSVMKRFHVACLAVLCTVSFQLNTWMTIN